MTNDANIRVKTTTVFRLANSVPNLTRSPPAPKTSISEAICRVVGSTMMLVIEESE